LLLATNVLSLPTSSSENFKYGKLKNLTIHYSLQS
jgi:hypothetical protein